MFRFFRTKKQEPDIKLVDRGNRAEQLLKSPAFAEALEDVENKVWEQFFATTADDPAARDVLYTHITALHNIKQTLEGFVEQGKLSKHIEETRSK